jgi:hypothetical protein
MHNSFPEPSSIPIFKMKWKIFSLNLNSEVKFKFFSLNSKILYSSSRIKSKISFSIIFQSFEFKIIWFKSLRKSKNIHSKFKYPFKSTHLVCLFFAAAWPSWPLGPRWVPPGTAHLSFTFQPKRPTTPTPSSTLGSAATAHFTGHRHHAPDATLLRSKGPSSASPVPSSPLQETRRRCAMPPHLVSPSSTL